MKAVKLKRPVCGSNTNSIEGDIFKLVLAVFFKMCFVVNLCGTWLPLWQEQLDTNIRKCMQTR